MTEERVTSVLLEKFGHSTFKSILQKEAVMTIAQGIYHLTDCLFTKKFLFFKLQASKMLLSQCPLVQENLYATNFQLFSKRDK